MKNNLERQRDAASVLEIFMEELLRDKFLIQKTSTTPSIENRAFVYLPEAYYFLSVPIPAAAQSVNAIIHSYFCPPTQTEKDPNEQRKFDLRDGLPISEEAAVDAQISDPIIKVESFQDVLRVKRLPDLLAIHLVRFTNERADLRKKTTPVHLPPDGCLDLSEFCDEGIDSSSSCLYDLTGYVIHQGGLHNGHYTARVKIEDNYWLCDDGMKTAFHPISSQEFYNEKQAYILIFKRRTI